MNCRGERRTSPCWAWLLAAAGLLLFGSCESQQQTTADPPLVQVGDEVITAGALRQYEQDLPTAFRLAASGAAVQREHLQSLVDRQLMLLEAGNKGYRRMPELKAELEQLANKKLIDQVTFEYITRQVEVTEEELLQEYKEADLGWMVRPARILCATEEEARKVVRELEQGADFAALAAARSLKSATEKGGDLGHFFGPEDVAPVLQEVIFDLPVGGISAPIRTVEGYEVLTILDRYRLPFDRLKERLVTQVRRRKWAARHLEYLEELKREDSLSQSIASDPKALSDTLLLREGRRQGFDQNAEFSAWKDAKREELLIRQLRQREVVDLLPSPSEEEVRQFYEAHIDGYSVPGAVYLTEVLLNTREEAVEIRRAAEAGQSLEELARKHSVRPRTDSGHGHVHVDQDGQVVIYALQSSPYYRLFQRKESQQVGQLQGPVELDGKFAVFRLDEPIEPHRIPFAKVRKHVRRQVKVKHARRAFEVYIDSLRKVYAGEVKWFDEHLAGLNAGNTQ